MSTISDANQIRKRGGVVELRFWMEATRRGVIVSKPHEVARYDFIVDCGERLFRVQVKSTTVKVCHQYKLALFTSPSKKPYTEQEVDFIAAYVIPEQAWYIFPLSAVLGKKFARLGPRTELAKYRDAWHLLLNKSQNVLIPVMEASAGDANDDDGCNVRAELPKVPRTRPAMIPKAGKNVVIPMLRAVVEDADEPE